MTLKSEYKQVKEIMLKGLTKDRTKLTKRQRVVYLKMAEKRKSERLSISRGLSVPLFYLL